MMKITSTLFFLLYLSFLSAFGQTDSLILTSEQNIKWLNSLKGMSLEKQLTTINKRLLSDTNIFVSEYYPDAIKVKDSMGKRVYGDGKPVIIIGADLIAINNKTNAGKIVELTNLISVNTIKNIKILDGNDQQTLAIYGTSALNGIIVMSLTKNKYSKRFHQFSSNQN
jgi:hypothetical protein